MSSLLFCFFIIFHGFYTVVDISRCIIAIVVNLHYNNIVIEVTLVLFIILYLFYICGWICFVIVYLFVLSLSLFTLCACFLSNDLLFSFVSWILVKVIFDYNPSHLSPLLFLPFRCGISMEGIKLDNSKVHKEEEKTEGFLHNERFP